MQGMRHPGVGRRAAVASLSAALTCLVAPSLLFADDAAAPPAPPAETTTSDPTTPPPAPPPPADDNSPSEPTPIPSGQGGDAETTGTPESTTSGATLLATKRGGVGIADFSFSPASITVGVGETVTWSNNGPSDHTVTADDGSFDSGTMGDGDGFSHTFSEAGTFAYVCAIHAEMKGSVVVSSGGSGPTSEGNTNGNATGTDPGTTGPTSESAAGESPSAAGTTDSLPSTGQNELPLALVAAGLFVSGLFLRRRSPARVP
jgi:LPXTG-motif cell wall-anchored protein